MLPGRDGFELVGLLRQGGPVPIIMLTARGQKADKLKGLKLGADDYVTKPFDVEELMARVHNVLRRSSPEVPQLVLGRVTIDFVAMTARHGRDQLHFTHREFKLLQYLAERPGRVVSRHELLREVWGYPDMPATRLVDNAVARVRKKLEPDPGEPAFRAHRPRRRLHHHARRVRRPRYKLGQAPAGTSPILGPLRICEGAADARRPRACVALRRGGY